MLHQLYLASVWFVSNSLRRIALLILLIVLTIAVVAPSMVALAGQAGGGSSPTIGTTTGK